MNWTRIGTLVGLYILAFFLQYGVLNNLGWGVLAPQLLMFFPVFGGMLSGPISGAKHGAIVGLLQDLVIGRFIGLNIITWAIVGFLAGFATRGLFKENYFIAILGIFSACMASAVTYTLLVGLVSGEFFTMTKISQICLGGMVSNCLLAPIIYVPTYRSLSYGRLAKNQTTMHQ